MAESLGDKPSSRVLRPPGGGSSNIFGGSDEPSYGKQKNVKPTFQSSVFNTEPAKPISASRPANQSSNIFGAGSDKDKPSSVSEGKKISKTHQSSIFQEPEPMSEEKRRAIAEHRISNIPMFSDAGPSESIQPIRRPITAPTRMPQSFDVSSDTNYATDTKAAPGERTKTRTGYKPANDNLQSTVFNLRIEPRRMQCRHFPEVKPMLFGLPVKPRVRARPVHRNETSTIFLSESEMKKIKNECQKRPMSVLSLNSSSSEAGEARIGDGAAEQNIEKMMTSSTYRSTVFESQDEADCATGQIAERKPLSNTYQSRVFKGQDDLDKFASVVFSADDKMACLSRHRPSTRGDESTTEETDSPIWSASDHGVVRCTRRAQCSSSRRMQESSLFKDDDCGVTPALWTSDFNMTQCSSKNSKDTSKSTIFDHQCNNGGNAASAALGNSAETGENSVSIKVVETVSSDAPNGLIVKTISDALRDVALDSSMAKTNRPK